MTNRYPVEFQYHGLHEKYLRWHNGAVTDILMGIKSMVDIIHSVWNLLKLSYRQHVDQHSDAYLPQLAVGRRYLRYDWFISSKTISYITENGVGGRLPWWWPCSVFMKGSYTMSRSEVRLSRPENKSWIKQGVFFLKRLTGWTFRIPEPDAAQKNHGDAAPTPSAEQIQCNLYYQEAPTRRVRLAGIERDEWKFLRSVVPHDKAPLLASLLACGAPIRLNRKSLDDLMEEIKINHIDHELAHIDVYITMTMFILQAYEQADAEAIFEVEPGAQYEGPTFLT